MVSIFSDTSKSIAAPACPAPSAGRQGRRSLAAAEPTEQRTPGPGSRAPRSARPPVLHHYPERVALQPSLDRRGLTWGLVAVALTLALTFVGSDGLVWFDAALVGYLFGLIFAVFGVVYRYAVWLRRPPTAMLNRRGWDAFRQRKGANLAALPALVGTQLIAQGFIRRRSRTRWLAHQLVFWGCILAALVTFPLTLGLLHFESVGQQADRYQVYLSRVGTLRFDADSVLGWLIFHALDIAAVLVLAGVFIFLRRRLRDPGALAIERGNDFLALAGLFAVSVTGLFLTVSSIWLEGRFYSALNTMHALTVILGLMYIPFGKLFHIFQRPGNLGVAYYKRANADGPPARLPPLRRARSPAPSRSPTSRRCSRRSASTTSSTAAATTRTPARAAAAPRSPSPSRPESAGSADGPPADHRGGADRPLRPAPQRGAARGLGRRARGRPRRQHALLLLRPAVRDQAQGPRQRGRRLRAVVRVPVQRGQALPEGRQALPPGQPPRPAAAPAGARPRRAGGFRRVTWDQALDRVVGEIRRIQQAYGNDAFAMLSGVSLTNEKSYLIGKFARLALRTANLDYNGRYCMVSAGTGNKKALGIDRSSNPWSDIPLADVVWIAGSNVAETFPITTSYIWQARDRGAKLIVQDPRVVPAGPHRRPLPRRPSGHRLGVVRRRAARADPPRLARPRVHRRPHRRLRRGRRRRRRHDPAWAAGITGVPAARIEQAAEWWGTAATGMLLHARGIEQHTKGVDNVLAAINLGLATGKFGKPGCGVSTITGQGNGQGGREHGHKCDQLPGNRDITNPEHRAHVASVWGCDESEIPGKGIPAQEIIEAIHAGEIKGLLSICFNPAVSAPDANFTAEALDRLEFYAVIDFFLSESAHHADVVLPGSLHEEDEGTSTSGEGRIIKINAAVDPPGEARRDWEILVDLAERLGRGRYFPYREHRGDLRGAPPRIEGRHRRLLRGHVAAHRGRDGPVLADPRDRAPGHAPALRGRHASSIPTAGPASTACAFKESAEVVDDEYPVWLTTGRVVSQYLSGTQTRRIGGLVAQYPEPLCEMHPRLAEQVGVDDGDLVTVTSRRGDDHPAGQRRDDDPARHGLHPVPLARRQGRQPAHQPGRRPARQDARVQGGRGRASTARGRRTDRRTTEPT